MAETEVDYLNQRTTNLNIRISPMLKTQLIDSGARQGLNLSDYIMHLLLTEMSGGNETDVSDFEEYNDLVAAKNKNDKILEAVTEERDKIKEQLDEYETLLSNCGKYKGQTMVVGGERFILNNRVDLLKAILKTIKIQEV